MGVVSSWSFGWSEVNLACITFMCSVQRFPGGHSLHLAFGSSFYPHPFPLYSSTDKSGDKCLVSLVWGLMAGGRGFASHGGVTLSRGWLYQKLKPLDILGTHLHQAMQLSVHTFSTKLFPTLKKHIVCKESFLSCAVNNHTVLDHDSLQLRSCKLDQSPPLRFLDLRFTSRER